MILKSRFLWKPVTLYFNRSRTMTGHEHSDKAQRNWQLYFKRTAVIGNLIAFRILQCTDFLMRKVSVMGHIVQNQCCFLIDASHFFSDGRGLHQLPENPYAPVSSPCSVPYSQDLPDPDIFLPEISRCFRGRFLYHGHIRSAFLLFGSDTSWTSPMDYDLPEESLPDNHPAFQMFQTAGSHGT